MQPHRRQPTRLICLWDSPGKNTGVGCHFLLQCMKVKSESEFAQLCRTLSDRIDCSLSVSSVHGILQARVLEWVSISFSRREWQNIFKVLKGKNLQPRLLYPARISFKIDGEIKSFSDKQKLRKFSTTKSALQQMLRNTRKKSTKSTPNN